MYSNFLLVLHTKAQGFQNDGIYITQHLLLWTDGYTSETLVSIYEDFGEAADVIGQKL